MSQPERSSGKRSTRRQRRSTGWRRVAAVWSEWRVEILIVLVIALAIFLLVEQMQIRSSLFGWLRRTATAIGEFGGTFFQRFVAFVQRTTLSDLVAYTLLLGTLVAVTWRVRWRLMTLPRFTERACPECGSDLQRIHRRPRDRLLNLIVPVRRYQCKEDDCRWHGLRFGQTRHH